MTYIEQSKGTNPQGQSVTIPVGGSSYVNSEPLEAGASRDTGWISTEGYGSLFYIIRSNRTTSITVEYSDDGVTAFMAGNALTYGNAHVNMQIQRVLAPKGKYTRLTFTNTGGTTATQRFEVRLSTTLIQPTETSLNAGLTGTELGLITANVVFADDGNGTYAQVQRTGNALNVQVLNPSSATDVSALAKDATVAKDGTDGTGITPPTGGTGIRGWLSGIFQKLSGTLNVSITNTSIPVTGFPATQPVSGTVTTTFQGSSTATVTTVTTLTTVTTVLAANPNRKGAKFFSVTGTILLKYGNGATTSNFTERLVTNGTHELAGPEPYKGVITAIGAGTLNVTEW